MYKIIITLGLLPLIGITVHGGYELAMELLNPPDQMDLIATTIEPVVVLSTILTDNDGAESRKLLEWVSEGTCAPFSASTLTSLSLAREPEKEVKKVWDEHVNELAVIKDCVLELSAILPHKLEMNRAQLIQASSNLKEAHDRIKSSVQLAGLSDVARSADHLEELAKELDAIVLQKEYAEFDKAVWNQVHPKVRLAGSESAFQDILNDLAKLKGTPDAKTEAKIASYEFQRDAIGLRNRLNGAISSFGSGVTAGLDGLVREFKALENQYGDSIPPGSEDAKELDRLSGQAKVVEGLARVDALGEFELERLKPWVRQAKGVLEEFDNETVKETVTKMVKNKFNSRLLKKPMAANPRLQYVTELGSGKVIEGVFSNGGTRWMPADGSPGLRKIHYGVPHPVPEIKSVETFNAIRSNLVEEMTTKRSWEQFQDTCDKLSADRNAYKGATNGSTFTEESEFARRVIENWDDLEALFSLLN